MRHLGAATFLLVVSALACPALCAEDGGGPGEAVVAPGTLHRPQDVAPQELVIVPRPPEEYLPKGSLLAAGARGPRQVDLDDLRRRMLDMYAGKPATDSLAPVDGAAVAPAPAPPPGRPRDEERGLAALVYWSLIAGCAVSALWLLLKVYLNFRRKRPVTSDK
jgi:hypothetical protein